MAIAEVERLQKVGKPVDVGNPLAESPTDEKKVMAAKQIQNHWKQQKRLEKDMSDDIEVPVELPKDDECGYEPLDYEGVSYQVDRETQDVLNMEGTKVGDLENGIVIFIHPYDDDAVKASAEVSDDSGDETEDMSSDEECEDDDE